MYWPKRLKKQYSRVVTATLASASSSPSAHNSREACGRILMPTPTALSSGAASKTRQAMPARCSIRPKVNPPMPAPIIRTSMVTNLFAMVLAGQSMARQRRLCAPGGDRRQKQRHKNVIAGERNSEETPGRLVTANDSDVLKLLQHIAGRTEAIDGSRAIRRPRPEFPFDAGVIGGEPRVPQHDSCDHRKTRDHDFARGAVIGAQAQQGCERNGHIKSITLLEAKRARRIAKNILEKEDSADRQRADNHYDRSCGEWQVAA